MAHIAAQPYDYTLPTGDRLALVIIDMQRDFLEPGGFGEALGNDVTPLREIVPTVQKLQQAFRDRGWLIIQTVEGHHPDLSDCPPSKRDRGHSDLKIGDPGPMGRILVLGEPGNGIIPELTPHANETVIAKPGKGAFYATSLATTLQRHGITHLIFTGVTTEVCVQSTMREANDRGYECLMLSDCTGATDYGNYLAALKMIKMQGGVFGAVATSTDLIDTIQS